MTKRKSLEGDETAPGVMALQPGPAQSGADAIAQVQARTGVSTATSLTSLHMQSGQEGSAQTNSTIPYQTQDQPPPSARVLRPRCGQPSYPPEKATLADEADLTGGSQDQDVMTGGSVENGAFPDAGSRSSPPSPIPLDTGAEYLVAKLPTKKKPRLSDECKDPALPHAKAESSLHPAPRARPKSKSTPPNSFNARRLSDPDPIDEGQGIFERGKVSSRGRGNSTRIAPRGSSSKKKGQAGEEAAGYFGPGRKASASTSTSAALGNLADDNADPVRGKSVARKRNKNKTVSFDMKCLEAGTDRTLDQYVDAQEDDGHLGERYASKITQMDMIKNPALETSRTFGGSTTTHGWSGRSEGDSIENKSRSETSSSSVGSKPYQWHHDHDEHRADKSTLATGDPLSGMHAGASPKGYIGLLDSLGFASGPLAYQVVSHAQPQSYPNRMLPQSYSQQPMQPIQVGGFGYGQLEMLAMQPGYQGPPGVAADAMKSYDVSGAEGGFPGVQNGSSCMLNMTEMQTPQVPTLQQVAGPMPPFPPSARQAGYFRRQGDGPLLYQTYKPAPEHTSQLNGRTKPEHAHHLQLQSLYALPDRAIAPQPFPTLLTTSPGALLRQSTVSYLRTAISGPAAGSSTPSQASECGHMPYRLLAPIGTRCITPPLGNDLAQHSLGNAAATELLRGQHWFSKELEQQGNGDTAGLTDIFEIAALQSQMRGTDQAGNRTPGMYSLQVQGDGAGPTRIEQMELGDISHPRDLAIEGPVLAEEESFQPSSASLGSSGSTTYTHGKIEAVDLIDFLPDQNRGYWHAAGDSRDGPLPSRQREQHDPSQSDAFLSVPESNTNGSHTIVAEGEGIANDSSFTGPEIPQIVKMSPFDMIGTTMSQQSFNELVTYSSMPSPASERRDTAMQSDQFPLIDESATHNQIGGETEQIGQAYNPLTRTIAIRQGDQQEAPSNEQIPTEAELDTTYGVQRHAASVEQRDTVALGFHTLQGVCMIASGSKDSMKTMVTGSASHDNLSTLADAAELKKGYNGMGDNKHTERPLRAILESFAARLERMETIQQEQSKAILQAIERLRTGRAVD